MAGNQRTEFTYDGQSRLASLRLLTNGSQASLRRFVWCDNEICEERDASGAVTKRFFSQGVKIETGPTTGLYFYARDHLGSIREVTDSGGSVQARYSYDPFGRKTRLAGDMETDFGFAGMFFTAEADLYLATFRAYDPELGRWLSRDPLRDAEKKEGPNLYAYVGNNPVNMIDPLGFNGEKCCKDKWEDLEFFRGVCGREMKRATDRCDFARRKTPEIVAEVCKTQFSIAAQACIESTYSIRSAARAYFDCMANSECGLEPPPCDSKPCDPNGETRCPWD